MKFSVSAMYCHFRYMSLPDYIIMSKHLYFFMCILSSMLEFASSIAHAATQWFLLASVVSITNIALTNIWQYALFMLGWNGTWNQQWEENGNLKANFITFCCFCFWCVVFMQDENMNVTCYFDVLLNVNMRYCIWFDVVVNGLKILVYMTYGLKWLF